MNTRPQCMLSFFHRYFDFRQYQCVLQCHYQNRFYESYKLININWDNVDQAHILGIKCPGEKCIGDKCGNWNRKKDIWKHNLTITARVHVFLLLFLQNSPVITKTLPATRIIKMQYISWIKSNFQNSIYLTHRRATCLILAICTHYKTCLTIPRENSIWRHLASYVAQRMVQ